MKIYTKTGDAGDTGLFGGPRVKKDDPRVEAYGAVDELNAALGVARAAAAGAWPELDALLEGAQHRLFSLGAELATPRESRAHGALPPVSPSWAAELEASIDALELELPPLRQFVLPGGAPLAAALHLARCVCRRAERRAVTVAGEVEVAPAVLAYLNRLSDWLFVAARAANHRAGTPDVPWKPPAGEG
ncbi:cob(I)yrinic acid a,c-diamide adenosyltransferase [Anaeromyxobacter paludicola]|uniref:Corrinoid adenosyltransferase n=1 Tax=Anaeromyxobacter paludicola TaxID=2918171 RepID=A0ABN6N9K0_9BACT|nr:cob(I)yrinic acid a,c-diamide adenosyltransferase [Anaeromyxobacter paludicola]BDG08789.1 ATP--cob(I)alamin adenosyltransferase [Anaeromyxobacter paludicola]